MLEIGCGTGALTVHDGRTGRHRNRDRCFSGDAGRGSKENCRGRSRGAGDAATIGCTLIGDHFAPASFDLIVSTLVFSELPGDEQRYVLEACARLLAPGGRLLIADEVIPAGLLPRLAY